VAAVAQIGWMGEVGHVTHSRFAIFGKH
jgi:hypothetical protein